MRININAYGMGNGSTFETLEKIDKYIGRQQRVVDTFKAVKHSVYNMNGGVGILDKAVGELDSRIALEEQRLDNAVKVQAKTNDFVKLAVRIDQAVASKVRKNKEEFYKVNPWARPPQPPREKAWYEKVGDWFCETGKAIAEGAKQFGEWVADTWNGIKNWASDTWTKIKDFIHEHATIIKIAISAVAIAACVVVAFFCPAAAPALILAAKMALVGMAIEGLANTPKLISNLIAPGEGKNRLDVFGDFLFQSTFDGMANGVSEVNPLAGALIKIGSSGLSSVMDGNSLTSGLVNGAIEYGIDQLTGKLLGGDGASGIGKLIDDGAKNFCNNAINTTINTISDLCFGTDFRGKDINWVSVPVFGEGFKDFAINTAGEWAKNALTRDMFNIGDKTSGFNNAVVKAISSSIVPIVPIMPINPVIPVIPIKPVIPTIPVTPVMPVGPAIPIKPVVPTLPTIPVMPSIPTIKPVIMPIMEPIKPIPFKPIGPAMLHGASPIAIGMKGLMM